MIITVMDAMREFESLSMSPKNRMKRKARTHFKRRKEIWDDAKNDHPNRSIYKRFFKGEDSIAPKFGKFSELLRCGDKIDFLMGFICKWNGEYGSLIW